MFSIFATGANGVSSILPYRYLVPNNELSQFLTDSAGNYVIQLWFNFRETESGSTAKDIVFSQQDKQALLNEISFNGINLGTALDSGDNVSVIMFDGNSGAQFYVKIIYQKSDGAIADNALNITSNSGYLHFEISNEFTLSDKYRIAKSSSYFLVYEQTWKSESEMSFVSATEMNVELMSNQLSIDIKTDKSVEENRGALNFQNVPMRASKRFRDCIAINGVTLKDCFSKTGSYGVHAKCTQTGIVLLSDIDCLDNEGNYTSLIGEYGIDYNTDFVFEILEGLVLNGNAVKPCKWLYSGDTHTSMKIADDYMNPNSVDVIAYNNRFNDGIIETESGERIIRLQLSDLVCGIDLSLQNKTNQDSQDDYLLSKNINKYLYIDGLNLEMWSGYRNSSLNTVKVNHRGSLIEIEHFIGWEPSIKKDEVHWLEIKDGFEIANGIKVNPIKLYYDPDKGYWTPVQNFDNIKEPEIIIKRNNTEYENTPDSFIDNSDVIPKYVPNSQVSLEDNGKGLTSPDWVKTLIIEEVNVLYASQNGMFSGMEKTLDHLEEMGVNGIWLDPIFAPSQYLMYGPDTVNPFLTGTTDYEAGWQIVADFVEKAHEHNIRVFFDIVTWGVHKAAPVVKEHKGWFSSIDPKYDGYNYNWENQELVEWFSNQLVKIIETTNADGFRADCGINYCGYDVYRKARQELYSKGYKICIFSEGAVDRKDVFDFEQNATRDEHFRDFAGTLFTNTYNILDVVKNGTGLGTGDQILSGKAGLDRFYTATLSHHDGYDYDVQGNIIKMGYSGILSPFIPLWFIGDEWNNPHVSADGNTWLFGTAIDWTALETNREYYEEVKKLIRIRRVYSDIFDYYPQNHRETNICAVETDHKDAIQAYARYNENSAILVVPNAGDSNSKWNIKVPFDNTGLAKDLYYVVTDLLTGDVLAKGSAQDISVFTAEISPEKLGVFAVEPTAYIVPHPQTQIVGDGRINLWFKIRDDKHSGSVVKLDLTDAESIKTIKENMYLNGINLGEAMDVSDNVKLVTFSDGQFYIQIRYASSDGKAVDNPFYISSDPISLCAELRNQIVLSETYINMDRWYYDFNKKSWSEQLSVFDVNGDGTVDIRDLVRLKKIIVQMENTTIQDINNDGKTDSVDLILLRKTLLNS